MYRLTGRQRLLDFEGTVVWFDKFIIRADPSIWGDIGKRARPRSRALDGKSEMGDGNAAPFSIISTGVL